MEEYRKFAETWFCEHALTIPPISIWETPLPFWLQVQYTNVQDSKVDWTECQLVVFEFGIILMLGDPSYLSLVIFHYHTLRQLTNTLYPSIMPGVAYLLWLNNLVTASQDPPVLRPIQGSLLTRQENAFRVIFWIAGIFSFSKGDTNGWIVHWVNFSSLHCSSPFQT